MQPPKALESGLDIDWTLSESCIITWKEDGHEPKNLGLGNQPVTLWFGTKQKNHQWVILLQRTINLRISDRSIPLEFFLFVDPHSILFGKSPVSILSDVPSQQLEAHSAKADRGWLGASVRQDHPQSVGLVLMQTRRPNSKHWEGMPLHRLRELKSLSDAPQFTIYLNNKRNVRKFVNRLQNELPKTLAPVHIDLRTAYEGRGGDWDAWDLYNDRLALPKSSDDTGDSTTNLDLPCKLLPLDQVSPPVYSKTDPNKTCDPRDSLTPPTVKRPLETPEANVTYKKLRDDKASLWAWQNTEYSLCSPTEENTPSSTRERLSRQSTVDDQFIHEGHSEQQDEAQRRQEDEVVQSALSSPNITVDDRFTQEHTPPPGVQLIPAHTTTPDFITPPRNSFLNLRSTVSPPYAASLASTASLDQVNIKPTKFTTMTPSTITLTLSELESLIAKTIRAQVPLIAAQVQTHNLTTEMTAWAQPSIADYIATHMPAIMYEAVSAHVSDVNDEFKFASAALQETKDEALVEIRSTEQSGIQEVHRESQIAVDDLQEHSQRLSEALADKCTELEERLDAKTSSSVPPEYSRQPLVGISSANEAVKVFERFHRGRLTPEEQVRVLLSIAKFSNAEVFMAADLESRKMLIAHWSSRKD